MALGLKVRWRRELFALGGGEDGVAEILDDALVGVGRCLSGSETVVIDVFVVEALVEVRHVGFRVADDVVVRDLARVHPPAAFELHFGIARLTLLGGDEHHTVGTARTVEGGRSCIFEYRDVFDVVGVDRREIAVVGNAVEDDEGVHLGIDRTETADADGGRRYRADRLLLVVCTPATVPLRARETSAT